MNVKSIIIGTSALLLSSSIAMANPLCPSVSSIQQAAAKISHVGLISDHRYGVGTEEAAISYDDYQWQIGSVNVVADTAEQALEKGTKMIQHTKYPKNIFSENINDLVYVCYYGPTFVIASAPIDEESHIALSTLQLF